jgi:hypothetical protein
MLPLSQLTFLLVIVINYTGPREIEQLITPSQSVEYKLTLPKGNGEMVNYIK